MQYTAASLQVTVHEASPANPAAIRRNVDRAAALIAELKRENADLALVVLPEHFLTGYDVDRSPSDWAEAGFRIDGPEVAALGVVARSHHLHIAAAGYEYDPSTPGHAWNTAFILGPGGDVLLRYRKHTPDLLVGGTRASLPLEVLGGLRPSPKRLFPTVRTEIGTLGCLVGEDLLYPELVRGVVLNGAEIVLGPIAERNDDLAEARNHSRHARAWENLAYLVTATPAGYAGSPRLAAPGAGSAIWDYHGVLLASAPSGAETAVLANLDAGRLRERRADPHINFPAQLRTQLYAVEYERGEGPKPGSALQVKERGDDLARARATIADLERRGVWPAPGSNPIKPYDVVMAQGNVTTVPDVEHRDEVIQMNLTRSVNLARNFARNPRTKLVVFPEYWLQGAPFGRSVDTFWPIVGIRVPQPGETNLDAFPEMHQLAEFAAEVGAYVSGAVFEFDPEWPRRWLNTAFVISPRGQLIHKYRKIQCADLNGMLTDTTPGNVYSKYIERYGEDGIFPVTPTEIGNLATCICFDNNFPELWRSLALRGAEVICYPTGEPHNKNRKGWEHTKRAHAFENQLYIVSANSGSETRVIGGPTGFFHRGFSRLVGFDGSIVVEADGPGEVALVGTIDIEALRRARHDPRRNLMASLSQELVAPVYRDHQGFPLDCFLEKPMEEASEGLAITASVVQRYFEEGVYTRPGERVAVTSPGTFVG